MAKKYDDGGVVNPRNKGLKDAIFQKKIEVIKQNTNKKYPNAMEYKATETIPSDIADQLQTSKNERAAAAYEKRRAAGDDYKKGGSVKSKAKPKCKCMARGGGCEVRGKTRGKMV